MAGHDATDQCQSDSGTGKFRRVVQSLKHAKQLRAVARIESRTIVPHEINVLLFLADCAHLDGGFKAWQAAGLKIELES